LNSTSDIIKTKIITKSKERWNNKQVLSISADDFTQNKGSFIIQLVHKKWTKWSEISKFFIERTDNCLKNRYQFFIQHQISEKEVFWQSKKEDLEWDDDFLAS
jgi:hypothetical protein